MPHVNRKRQVPSPDGYNRSTVLPFKIKQPNENFFNEGDVSEVSTLIEVDDDFVMNRAKTIRDVSDVSHRARPEFIA